MGREWKVGSLAGESGESLGICIDGFKTGVFCDFATGDRGDNLVELCKQRRQISFLDALQDCADWLGTSVSHQTDRQPHSPRSSVEQSQDLFLSGNDCDKAIQMAAALQNDWDLCKGLAKHRGWKAETIRSLTFEPSLGWHDGKLAFIYETGVKLRWRQQGERIVRWAFGKPWLWRGSLIDTAAIIYLCEGETDAISLIDAGLESDGQTLAVALPSSSTFNERWATLFAGKAVILAFDADRAGEEATRRVSHFLRPHVANLKQLNWRGLQRAS